MCKIHKIIDIIGQFVAQNRRPIEEPKEVLIYSLCQLLMFIFNEVCKSGPRLCVHCTNLMQSNQNKSPPT